MLRNIRKIWIEGVLEQSLYNVARLELGLTTQPNAVEETWTVLVQRPDQPQRKLPPGTQISSAFDELSNALLILGAPGSGKTTLLLELTQDLLDRAERDSNHKLPVVFNLSSWAVRRLPLEDWLADELNERYFVPSDRAESWVAQDLIIPLLDGLDEVAAECRSACAEAINIFRKEHGLIPMAVCSRMADYEALTAKLHLAGALVVQPLTREQTNHYLVQAGEPLGGLRAALRDEEILWELLDTPLMLSVATLAYQGRSAAEVLTTGTLEERTAQLFLAYTDAMFKRRSKALLYPRRQTVRWLTWLAFAMIHRNQSIFYLERLQLNWLYSKKQQIIVQLGIIIFIGITGALASQLLTPWVPVSLLEGFFSGIVLGLGNLTYFGNRDIRPVETLRWSWSKAKEYWIHEMQHDAGKSAQIGGLGGGVIGGLLSLTYGISSVDSPLPYSLTEVIGTLIFGIVAGGLIFGLCGILLFGTFKVLMSALVSTDITNRVVPNDGIRRSVRNAFLLGLFSWPIATLICIPLVGVPLIAMLNITGLDSKLSLVFVKKVVLSVGLLIGLIFGLRNGGIACFQHLALRLLLWRNGFAPWRCIRFLDYAAERVFLRKVGGGYIFIHRMLMEYFAALLQPSDIKS